LEVSDLEIIRVEIPPPPPPIYAAGKVPLVFTCEMDLVKATGSFTTVRQARDMFIRVLIAAYGKSLHTHSRPL
jgi:hypothetical protein